MFHEKMLRWARIVDLFAVTREAVFVLAIAKLGSPLAAGPILKSKESVLQETRIAAQRDLAMANLRLGSVNR